MAIRRRETKAGVRSDVEWRMPDRSPGKLFGATLRAIFRHTANRRPGRILAA
jgi:hypothetical protein